jgi:hypothetical protein
VLVSAVTQLARQIKLPNGLLLYRGTGGRSALPDPFYREDAKGWKGFVELGFMSTTTSRSVHSQRFTPTHAPPLALQGGPARKGPTSDRVSP